MDEAVARSRILMVDDNPLGLAARRSILEALGYDVVTAGGGEEGLRCFVERNDKVPIRLVVTDYRMPDLRGDEFIRRLREMGSKVPVVILSGYAAMLALTPESTGADVVLSKGPREQFDLVDTVARLVLGAGRQRGKPPGMERRSATARSPYRPRKASGSR